MRRMEWRFGGMLEDTIFLYFIYVCGCLLFVAQAVAELALPCMHHHTQSGPFSEEERDMASGLRNYLESRACQMNDFQSPELAVVSCFTQV